MSPAVLDDFERAGYLLGVKLSMNRKFLFFESGLDLFQSISKGKKGCLDRKGRWLDSAVHYRKLLRVGSIKLYLSRGYWKDRELVE
jgi:hypothetical protein